MKLHRFIGKFDLTNKNLLITDKEVINQISRVLRLQPDEQIILSDGNLNEAIYEIEKIGKEAVEGLITHKYKNENELPVYGILYCANLKKENFEFVAQKATELGIREIAPVISSRTIKLNINRQRIEKIIKESAEQSGRGIIPKISEPVEFTKAVENAAKNNLNLFFDLKGKSIKSARVDPHPIRDNPRSVGVWIGPEGGWSEGELELAKKIKFNIISLGALTLRAETAAIAAITTAFNIKNLL